MAMRRFSAPSPLRQTANRAELLQLLEREQVANVAARLKDLDVRYTGGDPCTSIEIGLQAETRQHLVRLMELDDSSGQHIPSANETHEMWGLRRLLCDGVRPAQLCHQQVLGRASLTLRLSDLLPEDSAVGWLAGRLTEAGDRKASSFCGNELFIPAAAIDDVARHLHDGLSYEGPDLMLEMTHAANEFRFLQGTVLRPGEGNVKPFVMLLRDNERGLVLPLPIVYTTRAVHAGEELVAVGLREDEEEALARVDKAAGKRDRKAAEEAAANAAELLQRAAQEQLLLSGYYQHTLAIFAERLFALIDQLIARKAASVTGSSAVQALRAVRREAFLRLFGDSQARSGAGTSAGSNSGSDAGGSSESSSSCSGGGGSASALPRSLRLKLQAAVEASLLQHPPPASSEQLSRKIRLPLEERYRLVEPSQLPAAQRACDFSQLSADDIGKLDTCLADCAPLPQEERSLLRSGMLSGAEVNEIVARLHRVRLLTPPNVRALSLNAPRDGAQLLPGQGIIVYMGRVHAHSEDFSSDSAYLFGILAEEVAERTGGKYNGPDLVVDASFWRNEAALANCVFGSGLKRSLSAEVVCDPETRRPYIMLRYCFSARSKPMQELLLDYEWDSYWRAAVVHLRGCHEQYMALAAQVIALLWDALLKAGVPQADREACLEPVNLQEHQLYTRVPADVAGGQPSDAGAESSAALADLSLA